LVSGGSQMSIVERALEERVEELATRVQQLELRLEQVTKQFGKSDAVSSPRIGVPPPIKTSQEEESALDEPADVSEEMLSWVGRAALLPRLATLCFLLVIALILRTLTDSGLVNSLIGSGLGMGYSAALMIVGWYKYGKASPLAPIFAACGAILMSSIIVETHTHFQSLPLVPAYLTLMATGIGMALISRQFNTFVPISVGILGMCFAGAAIDYPHPYFPYLSLVLFTSNILGYFAARMKQCSWLRWSVLVVTMIMLQLWGLRLGIMLHKGEAIPPELAPAWYLPVLAVFFLTFISLSLLGIVKAGTQKISRFDFSLPTLSVIWAFTLARHVVEAWKMNVKLLGLIGLFGAAVLLFMTFWFARRRIEGTPGTNTFAFAGGALLALALPVATGAFVISLPVISLVAITMAIVSRVWENGGVRGTTYLMNIYACVALVFALRGEGPESTDPINMLPAGLLAVISIYHYQWCRRWPVPVTSALFDAFDRKDRSAVLLLLGGLASGFFMIRVGFFQAIQFMSADMQRDTFRSGQSVLINSAAIALILFAYLRRDKEVRNVAILVTVVGGIKVFLYDLLGTHGLPLVFSVFSFGMAAAVESVALGKWMKGSDITEDTTKENT
jgi:hypothetical protein